MLIDFRILCEAVYDSKELATVVKAGKLKKINKISEQWTVLNSEKGIT